ncbi:hypothetical protein CBM2606_A150071 [Cupriavidus taiwanensis]|nr:hypothetical protein CBM2606_A150071 [Cupriavidus taiwanensis]
MLAHFPLNIEPRQLRVSRVQTSAHQQSPQRPQRLLQDLPDRITRQTTEAFNGCPRLYPVSRSRQATRISASVTGVPGLHTTTSRVSCPHLSREALPYFGQGKKSKTPHQHHGIKEDWGFRRKIFRQEGSDRLSGGLA